MFLSDAVVEARIREGLARLPYDKKRVLVLVPDLSRTMPLPQFFRHIVSALRGRVAKLDFLVALGTHAALTEAQMDQLFGCAPGERAREYSDIAFLNHDWKNPAAGGATQAAIVATGYAPGSDSDSAILVTLQPGAYTTIVRGKNGATGVAVVETFLNQ